MPTSFYDSRCYRLSSLPEDWPHFDLFLNRRFYLLLFRLSTDLAANGFRLLFGGVNGIMAYSSAGISKFTSSPRKPRVFHAPKTMPAAIQMPPAIRAVRLRLSHKIRHTTNPIAGGIRFHSFFSLSRTIVAHERGGIHAHESDQRAEVQHLRSEVKIQQKAPEQADNAYEDHVVARHMVLGVDRPEEDLGRALLRPMPNRRRAAPS